MERSELLELWAKQAQSIGGTNPLTAFELSSFGQVDLSRAHPGGLAQLSSNKSSTITNLVRDGIAQSRALTTSRRIARKANRIQRNFGIDALFVAGGLVTLTDHRMPVLLWKAHLLKKGDDLELRVDSTPRMNPALVKLIKTYRSDFRVSDLLAICQGQTDLIPTGVLSLVTELIQHPELQVEKLLVLGNFVPDLDLDNSNLQIPEGSALSQIIGKTEIPPSNYQIPELTLVQNADGDQQKVIGKALAGDSFAVETLPGCGYLQTLVNLLANLALENKRALILAPRDQTLDEVAERLNHAKLPGLAVRESEAWKDVVSAISRNEKSDPADLPGAKLAVEQSQQKVEAYFEVLHSNKNSLGISLIQAMEKLANLAALPGAPVNSARIKPELLPTIQEQSEGLLKRAHEAGLFSTSPSDGPWFQARFDTDKEIATAVTAAKELAGEQFRILRYQINLYLQDINLKPCNTIEQWSQQLNLLLGIRETLDRFKPEIFDRPITELIDATAPRGERGNLSGAQRRRFKKLAKGYLRPGASVSNLHALLVAAESQRVSWDQLNITQSPPEVPLGLADIQSKFEEIYQTLQLLQKHLNPDPDIELLTQMNLDDLAALLKELAEKTGPLDRYIERLPMFRELTSIGLAEFTKEVSKTKPDYDQLQREFELTWWQSALEMIIQTDPRIMHYGQSEVAEIESEFERANERLLTQGLEHVRYQLSQKWREGITNHPAQADQLRAMLRTKKFDIKAGAVAGDVLYRTLVSNVLISPYRLEQLSPNDEFDVVIILDAASTGMAEAHPALTKAKQVIAFGDPVIAAPENFDTVARANQVHVEAERASVFEHVNDLFGSLAIARNYRIEGQVLGRYLNDNFYSNRLVLEPAAGQLFGTHNFEQIEITEGANATSTIEGATESLDAEVNKVVDMVLSHARWTPAQSLMVVTASRTHAERISQKVQEQVAVQPQIAEFFDAHGREQFECVSMSELTHRLADRVIFSVGFGRTPEGKISGTLGDFNSPSANRWMVNQIVSARKRMSVVSCYNFEDFAGGSLPANQRWLKDLIAPSFLSDFADGDGDPLLKDLALRLQKLGLKVSLNFGGRIGLAASYGTAAAVVDPDWALIGSNWDEKLRVRPGLLRAMGWDYHRVHALEMFAKPQDVANRIAMKLGVDLVRKAQPLFDEKAFEDTPQAWGDDDDSNDDRLRDDKPPHWG